MGIKLVSRHAVNNSARRRMDASFFNISAISPSTPGALPDLALSIIFRVSSMLKALLRSASWLSLFHSFSRLMLSCSICLTDWVVFNFLADVYLLSIHTVHYSTIYWRYIHEYQETHKIHGLD